MDGDRETDRPTDRWHRERERESWVSASLQRSADVSGLGVFVVDRKFGSYKYGERHANRYQLFAWVFHVEITEPDNRNYEGKPSSGIISEGSISTRMDYIWITSLITKDTGSCTEQIQ